MEGGKDRLRWSEIDVFHAERVGSIDARAWRNNISEACLGKLEPLLF